MTFNEIEPTLAQGLFCTRRSWGGYPYLRYLGYTEEKPKRVRITPSGKKVPLKPTSNKQLYAVTRSGTWMPYDLTELDLAADDWIKVE
jgi:hypothetical protein